MQRRNFIFSMLAGIGVLAGGAGLFVRQEKFGRAPSGARLERIKASPHYVDGQFVCLEPVDAMMDDLPEEEKPNRLETLYRVLFGGDDGRVPKEAIPSNKTDLHAIPREQDVAVWMGHSTFYLQVGGRRILVDPVFSAYGSPIFFINRAFRGSNVYTAADIPALDVLLMTHDHWDHLDYDTVMALKPKVKEIICPLGVGEFFEQWGFDLAHLHEEDWDTEYGSLDLAVRVVENLDEAIDHIRAHTTGHTEAVLAQDVGVISAFIAGMDSAAIMVNASTRFTDGGQLGLGAELGISTQKLHARGPMGLAALTTTQWIVQGNGHVRPD